jgi:heme A synthase
MSLTLQLVHRNLGYAVFLLVLVAVFVAFRQAVDAPAVSGLSRVTMIVLDVHVAIGIALYLTGAWWGASFLTSVAHPLLAVGALGVGHAAIARGRREGGTPRTVATGLFLALLLVTAAIFVVSI